MTESPVKVEGYLAEIREEIKQKLRDVNFVGSLKFEVNFKQTDITNMNIDIRKSVKI